MPRHQAKGGIASLSLKTLAKTEPYFQGYYTVNNTTISQNLHLQHGFWLKEAKGRPRGAVEWQQQAGKGMPLLLVQREPHPGGFALA